MTELSTSDQKGPHGDYRDDYEQYRPDRQEKANVPSKQYLPCPFCGDRDIRIRFRGHPTSGGWVIECGSCSCEIGPFESQTEAWERWNKRPPAETAAPPRYLRPCSTEATRHD